MKTPVRILQIGMTDKWGGIESFLMNYYENINIDRIQFDFINIYDNNLYFKDKIISLGGKIYSVNSYYKHPFKYIKDVSKIIKNNDYKIVHCNMNSAAMLYPLIAAKMAKAKVIIAHSHNSSSDKGMIKSMIHYINKHFIPLFANYYFACSEKAGKWFFSETIRKSNRYKIIYNSIDVQKFEFQEDIRIRKRAELKITKNSFVIGNVSRFNLQKNHEFLIDIFYKYNKINQDAKLMLIGIGDLQDIIKEKVEKLGINKSVYFLGERKDVNELMQAMDIFILPSLYEGLPLVGVEAQASGLPCLFSDTITREIKILNQCYFLSNDNVDNYIKQIERLDNYNLERRKQANDIIKLSNYNIINSSKDLEKMYLEMGNECGK